MSEFIPPPGAIISDVEEEKNQQGGFILPEGAIATDVDKEPSMEADALGAIEDEVIDKTAGKEKKLLMKYIIMVITHI